MSTVENRSQLLAARLTSAAIIVLGLYVAKPVLMPLGLAVLVAFMLQPAVRWLRRRRLPNGVAVALTAAVFLAVLGLLVWVIAGQVQSLSAYMTKKLPEYRQGWKDKIVDVRTRLRGGSIDTIKSTVNEVIETVEKEEKAKQDQADQAAASQAKPPAEGTSPPSVPAAAEEPPPTKVVVTGEEDTAEGLSSAATLLAPLGTAGLVGLLVVLLLLKWSDLRARLIAMFDHHLTTTTAAFEDAAHRVSRYLAMQFLVNAATGLTVWAGLSLIGLEWAGLMGLCAGLFRYVPYIGPLAAAALPIVLSVAMMPGWGPVLAIIIFFICLELVLNNVIEPWLYGSSVGVSEIGIIMAAVAWTLLWGPAGLVLATPLTVCLVVLGEHVPGLAIFSKLLSDRSQLPVHATLTQRLMAGDTIEATDILAGHLDRAGAEDTYDTVVVPALARVRHEQRLGHLDAAAATSIAVALPSILAELATPEAESTVTLAKNSTLAVWSLCPMTEAAALMLPVRFHSLPCEFALFNTQSLASDVVARLRDQPPLGIVLLHLDPSDYPRVTATLRRVRRGLPDLPVLVGRWGEHPLTPAEREELAALGAGVTVATPAELAAWVSPRAFDVASIVPETAAESAPPTSS